MAEFKDWYDENKEALSGKRKNRYANDEEYREKARKRARKYYWLKKREATDLDQHKVDLEEVELNPNEELEIIVSNEDDIRYGQKLQVPVYYNGNVADLVGRTVLTLKKWFYNGYLPEKTYRNAANYRLYTEDQVKAMLKHRHLLEMTVKDFSKHPFFLEVRKGWEKLDPDGIVPMPEAEWREDPSRCPWCGHTPALQRLDENGEWETVPCFECIDPVNVEDRGTLNTYHVTGTCLSCNTEINKKIRTVGEKIIVKCDECNSRIPDVDIRQIN